MNDQPADNIRPRHERSREHLTQEEVSRLLAASKDRSLIQNAEGRFYIGMTTDLEQRLQDHNMGISKWTKCRGPWKLVWSLECASISEARKLEDKLKRQGRGNGFYRMIGLTPPSGS